MKKKRILMVCEAFGGGVFTYVSQLCNDMVDEFDVYLAYSLRPQTPKNYTDFLDQRVHLIEMENVGVKGLTNLKSDIAAIKELRQIEKDVKPDVIHLHSSVAGGLGRLAYKGKNNTVVYTPHGYAHILMGPGKKSKIYKFAEKVLGNKALTLTCCESEDEEAKKFSRRTAYVETGVNLADLSASLLVVLGHASYYTINTKFGGIHYDQILSDMMIQDAGVHKATSFDLYCSCSWNSRDFRPYNKCVKKD